MLRSILRIDSWQSGLTLYRHDIALSPESFDLNNNLGVELHRHNYVEQAQQYFLHSTKLAPYWWTNWNNLGVTLEAEGNLQAAAEAYLLAIENGEYYLAYENYARLLIKAGQTQEAKAFLELAIEKFPHNSNLQAWVSHLY